MAVHLILSQLGSSTDLAANRPEDAGLRERLYRSYQVSHTSHRHVPHVHGGFVWDVEGVACVFILCGLEGVDPWVASTCGCNVLGCNVVAEVPVLGVCLAVRTLRREANHRKHPDREEATTIIAPEILREVACQGGRGCHCVPRHW